MYRYKIIKTICSRDYTDLYTKLYVKNIEEDIKYIYSLLKVDKFNRIISVVKNLKPYSLDIIRNNPKVRQRILTLAKKPDKVSQCLNFLLIVRDIDTLKIIFQNDDKYSFVTEVDIPESFYTQLLNIENLSPELIVLVVTYIPAYQKENLLAWRTALKFLQNQPNKTFRDLLPILHTELDNMKKSNFSSDFVEHFEIWLKNVDFMFDDNLFPPSP